MSVKYFGGGGYNPPNEPAAVVNRNAELTSHENDTTSVHGITDTATLLTRPMIKTQRVSTGTIAGTSSATITLTWTTPFSNANYTVTVSIFESSDQSQASIQLRRIISQTASQVKVVVVNDALVDKTGTLHFIAVAD